MIEIYQETNEFLERCFHELEKPFPSPVPTMLGKMPAFRYEEKHHCLELAILQKLARYVSGLNASFVLLQSGFTQELGAIFRTLDEFGEDIHFLALPLMTEMEVSKTHKDYLAQHFQEEFDNPDNPILSTQKRASIPRQKIQSTIANFYAGVLNPSDAGTVFRTISKAYSGYVHGAYPHICELIGHMPPEYFLSGMADTPRQTEFEKNYWDYSYRGLLKTVCAAKAFGDAEVVKKAYDFIEHFEKITKKSGTGDAEKLMKKIKKKI